MFNMQSSVNMNYAYKYRILTWNLDTSKATYN